MNDMEDKEKLKTLILARVAGAWRDAYDTVDEIRFGEFSIWPKPNKWWSLCKSSGGYNTITYQFGLSLPASDPVWALVAPILGIQIGK